MKSKDKQPLKAVPLSEEAINEIIWCNLQKKKLFKATQTLFPIQIALLFSVGIFKDMFIIIIIGTIIIGCAIALRIDLLSRKERKIYEGEIARAEENRKIEQSGKDNYYEKQD